MGGNAGKKEIRLRLEPGFDGRLQTFEKGEEERKGIFLLCIMPQHVGS